MAQKLVIQLARFGDLLQTGRLLRSLERPDGLSGPDGLLLPGAESGPDTAETGGENHLCVDQSLVSLARRLHPSWHVHGVAAQADAGQSGTGADTALISEILIQNRKACGELAAIQADAVYNLNHSGMNRALAALFPSERVWGYRLSEGQPMRDRWMRMAFRWMGGPGQRRFAPLNLADFWGLLAPHPLAPTEVNPVAAPGGRGLGVVLAGRQARRSLPPEVLAPLVNAFFERLGGPPVYLLGSRAERPVAHELTRYLPRQVLARTVNLAGRTDWDGLCEALTGLDLLLSPDTGTMHLAARLGVPVHGLFLSSAWAWETGPYGLGHTVWQAAPGCAPCAEAAACPWDVRCLTPFRSPAFLRFLARKGDMAASTPNSGGRDALPPGLTCLSSGFDELGQIWLSRASGKNEEDDEAVLAFMQNGTRDVMRSLLADYAGLGAGGGEGLSEKAAALRVACAETLYQEADWMLPDRTL